MIKRKNFWACKCSRDKVFFNDKKSVLALSNSRQERFKGMNRKKKISSKLECHGHSSTMK